MAARADALRGARALTISTLLAKIVGFCGQLGLARLLAPGEFGIYVFAIGIATIGVRLASFDTRRDVLRCDAATAAARARAYLAVQATCGLVVAAVLAACGPQIVDALSRLTAATSFGEGDRAIAAAPLVAALAFLPFCESLRTPMTALLERELRFGYLARLELAGTILQVTLWVTLAARGAGPWALVAGAYGASLVRIAFASRATWASLAGVRASSKDYRSVRRFGSALWIVSLLAAGFWSGKDVLAGAGLGLAAAGLFGMAFEIPRALLQVAEGWSRVGLALIGRGDDTRQRRVVALVIRGSAAVLAPALVVGVLHPELVLRCCFGTRWVPAAPAFRVFMILAACEGSLRVWSDVATSRGRPELPLRASAVTAVLLPIFATLGFSHGIGGLAWAVLAAWAVPMPFCLAWVRRELDLSILPLLRPALTAIVAAIVVFELVHLAAPVLPTWAELVGAGLELAVFAIVVLRMDPELASLVREALARRRIA